MIVAIATSPQVANAIKAFATVRGMATAPAPDQDFRRDRLRDLSLHPEFGNNSALAIALGYKGPAYVRQMIAGERPITEKTIAAIDKLRGGKFKGWFSHQAVQESASVWPLDPWVTRDVWEQLGPHQRNAVAYEAHKALRDMRAQGVVPVPAPVEVSARRKSA